MQRIALTPPFLQLTLLQLFVPSRHFSAEDCTHPPFFTIPPFATFCLFRTRQCRGLLSPPILYNHPFCNLLSLQDTSVQRIALTPYFLRSPLLQSTSSRHVFTISPFAVHIFTFIQSVLRFYNQSFCSPHLQDTFLQSPLLQSSIKNELACEKVLIQGLDKAGRPILIVQVRGVCAGT